jgi:hypothetical protein
MPRPPPCAEHEQRLDRKDSMSDSSSGAGVFPISPRFSRRGYFARLRRSCGGRNCGARAPQFRPAEVRLRQRINQTLVRYRFWQCELRPAMQAGRRPKSRLRNASGNHGCAFFITAGVSISCVENEGPSGSYLRGRALLRLPYPTQVQVSRQVLGRRLDAKSALPRNVGACPNSGPHWAGTGPSWHIGTACPPASSGTPGERGEKGHILLFRAIVVGGKEGRCRKSSMPPLPPFPSTRARRRWEC